jgi:hypothetical protein
MLAKINWMLNLQVPVGPKIRFASGAGGASDRIVVLVEQRRPFRSLGGEKSTP